MSLEGLHAEFEEVRQSISPDKHQRIYDVEHLLGLAQEIARRESAPPPRPGSLVPSALEQIVEKVQGILWLDLDEDGHDAWNKDKEWSADTIEAVADVLIAAGLRPEGSL